MNTNDIIVRNILLKLDELDNDENFKKNCPGIKSQEYLYSKVYKVISLKRLVNILHGKAKKIKVEELVIISKALNVSLNDLVKK